MLPLSAVAWRLSRLSRSRRLGCPFEDKTRRGRLTGRSAGQPAGGCVWKSACSGYSDHTGAFIGSAMDMNPRNPHPFGRHKYFAIMFGRYAGTEAGSFRYMADRHVDLVPMRSPDSDLKFLAEFLQGNAGEAALQRLQLGLERGTDAVGVAGRHHE